jgi:predicted chitinase
MALSKVGKALKAAESARTLTKPDTTTILIWVVGLFPSWLVLGALAFVFLVIIVLLLGVSGSSSVPDPSASGNTIDFISATTGDGKGTFAADKVPKDLVDPLKKAGKECDLISPAVLAAQIEVESNFDSNKVGPNGETGISQLPPDVFTKFGKDDDNNGKVSALDPTDSIFAQARYLCALGSDVKKLLDDQTAIGDQLTLTLVAWDVGLDSVKEFGGLPMVDPGAYPFQVRALFSKYLTDTSEEPTPAPSSQAAPASAPLTEAQFEEMFPGRNQFYTYAGLVAAMDKFPAFAGTGDDTVRNQEVAAFLANVDHESSGLVFVEEVNRSAWGNYCDAAQSYGCPAGTTAYHGRGPLQLSWNNNYKAAGDALGIDLLNDPDKVKNDPAVAWQTAMWFWMTQSGAGSTTPHAAITGGGGFGETIRSINGALECNGGNPAQVQSRVSAYQRITAVLGVEPGDKLSC